MELKMIDLGVNCDASFQTAASDAHTLDSLLKAYSSQNSIENLISVGDAILKLNLRQRVEIVRQLISRCCDRLIGISARDVRWYLYCNDKDWQRIMPLLFRYDVCKGYCKCHGPDSGFLRQVYGFDGWGGWPARCRTRYGQDLLEKFDQKEWATVIMSLITRAEGMNWDLIEHALKSDWYDFVRHGLEENLSVTKTACQKILFWVCAHKMDDDERCEIIRLIERRFPKMVSEVHDQFGGSLLWYTLFQTRNAYLFCNEGPSISEQFSQISTSRTATLLIHYGCDPIRRHDIGLSWKEMCEA